MDRSPGRVEPRERQSSSTFIRLATAGVVAYSLVLPLLSLYRIVAAPVDPGRAVYAAPALACYLPLQTWLVLSAARDDRGRAQLWVLAAMAVVIVAMLPLVGVVWLGEMYVLGALVLLSIRPPWSLAIFAGLVVVQTPLAFALGHREWANYFTLGQLTVAMPLAVGVLLVRAARQLQAARLALAEEAVVRERLRIDGELGRTLGTALETIAERGDRAASLAGSQRPAADRELRALVGASRQTLAEARRIATRYREVSLGAELTTAVTLLSAAGIEAELALPPGDLPDGVDQRTRAALRDDVARLLGDGTAPGRVTIAVVRDGVGVRVELRP